MRKPALSYVLPAVLELLSIPALCGEKMIEGLVFNPVQEAGQKSVSGLKCAEPFFLRQEPDPYFQDVRKNRVNGSMRFERHGEVLENFPDELTLHLVFSPTYLLASCTAAVRQFDPGKIKFKAAWRNGARMLPAEGTVVLSEREQPSIWCEVNCGEFWVYELRIESSGVPLTDHLEITIEAESGIRVAQFTGELGSYDLQILINPALNQNLLSRTSKLSKP